MPVSLTSSRLRLLVLLAALLLGLIDPALAQSSGGLDRVNTFVDNILSVLRGISVSVATIAIIWAGYKFLFRHADISEIIYILGGGLLIGAAAEIARYMVSTSA